MNSAGRISIDRWKQLWNEDRTRWAEELRDRPARFDKRHWKKAVRTWRNEIPREAQESGPPLAGVPFLVKDLFDVAGEVTGCSSRVLLEKMPAVPAVEDAHMVRYLRELGAFPLGRTNMNEFAYGLDGLNGYTGNCPHPLDSTRVSGGSSSGSAWAVAAGVVPLALGTDTGGSIRVPAALCGIFGYRPAWSAHDTAGVFPLARTFDTAGWFTASATDMLVTMRELVRGFPAAERTDDTERLFRYYLPPGVELDQRLSGTIEEWTERIREVTGGKVLVEPAPSSWRNTVRDVMQEALEAYNVVGSSEAWEVHREWLDPYRDWYQPVVWSLIDRGRHWSEERVRTSRAIVARMSKTIRDALSEVTGGLILPATPVPTPAFSEIDAAFREQTIRLNAPGSMAGVPVLSVPLHLDAIRSGGLQVLVSPGKEHRLCAVLRALR